MPFFSACYYTPDPTFLLAAFDVTRHAQPTVRTHSLCFYHSDKGFGYRMRLGSMQRPKECGSERVECARLWKVGVL